MARRPRGGRRDEIARAILEEFGAETADEAQEALRGIARRTPLDRAPKFGENVYIKAENLQLPGAFKLRGAYNKILSLTPEEAALFVQMQVWAIKLMARMHPSREMGEAVVRRTLASLFDEATVAAFS